MEKSQRREGRVSSPTNMKVKKMTTRKIISDYGSVREYAEQKGISEASLRALLSVLGASSRVIEDQLEKDGYGQYLRIDRENMKNKLLNQKEAVNEL